MPCYSPLRGWLSRTPNANGKRSVVFNAAFGFSEPLQIPCGQCIGCRLERSRQWAVRCMHEAQLHDENCFVTLTYRDGELPPGGSLDEDAYPRFMKRLRRRLQDRVSVFYCGEYGAQLSRPHYHGCLFGYDFPDKKFFKRCADGSRLYTSELLQDLWPYGFSTIGAVTFESAAYCARYALKKITGEVAKSHYERVDVATGEIFSLVPEFARMSLRPAIAKAWYEKFSEDVFPSDTVVSRGREMRPPKYYDRLHEQVDEISHKEVKANRVAKAKQFEANQTPERLRVRREVKEAQLKFLKRELE